MTPPRWARTLEGVVDYIALAIPAFFALMGVEYVVSRWRKLPVYRFADWVANLGCGIIQQTFKVVLALFTFLAYRYLFENHRLAELDGSSPWVWLVAFLGVDFCYYWFHRASHEVNFLWAAHVVHHQSEEYNLGVALRQSALQGGFSWIFYLPLALVGFPPLVFAVIVSFNTLYQFWIHTRLIDRLGPLEYVFNTPSHHRVHHGQNPQYIDRNHAGSLIIWDKMFGTFEPEGEAVVFGVTEPPRSWNPLFANYHHWALSARRSRGARRLVDKAKVWLTRPGYVPPGVVDDAKRVDPNEKYDTPVSRRLLVYVAAQFGLLAAGTTAYLFFRRQIDPGPLFVWGAVIIGTAGSLGAVLDGAPWARRVELARPLAAGAAVAIAFPGVFGDPAPLVALGALALGSSLAFRSLVLSAEAPAGASPGPSETPELTARS